MKNTLLTIFLCFVVLVRLYAQSEKNVTYTFTDAKELTMLGQRFRLSRWNIPTANYSGITYLGGNKYAVVSDVEPEIGFYIWNIVVDSLSGGIVEIKNEGYRGTQWPYDRDAEGVAFCAQRGTLFVSGEADQRILEHYIDGRPTGCEMKIPEKFSNKNIQENRGFEALAYDEGKNLFWTCTESPTLDALEQDAFSRSIILQSFSLELQPQQQYTYELDAPQARSKGVDYYHGVVAIAPANDGTLFVLEREARITKRGNGSKCWVKLFRYNPDTEEKYFIQQWRTRFHLFNTRFANYEGMCLGPTLLDGTRTLFLLSDSQAGYGKAFWRLKDYINVIKLPR